MKSAVQRTPGVWPARYSFRLAAAVLVAFSALLTPLSVHASSNNYALSRVINVAILRIPSTVAGSNQSGTSPNGGDLLSPYIFDILNNRPDVKPSLWKLVNPLAPVTVDSEVNSRFGGLYTPDQQVTPNMAPYWEVDLNKIGSASQLAQFNLLVIRTDGDIDMSVTERRILRQYVDQGGTLWIDGSPNGTAFDTDKSNLFRVFFGGAAAQGQASYHPIATTPYAFSSNGLANLGWASIAGITGCPGIYSNVPPGITAGTAPDVTMFQQVGGSLIAGDYGAGHVIIDGLGVGDFINAEGVKPYNRQNIPFYYNSAISDGTNFTGSPASDLQFLVNVITYATSSQNPNANVRGNGSQGGNLSGALDASWQSFFGAGGDAPAGIATYGNFVYTTDLAGNLNCYDVNPPESIFPDANNGDDGIPDYANGTSFDMVWTVNLGGLLSSPVVALIPNGTSNVEAVLAEDAYGNVYGFPAVYDPVANAGAPAPPQLFKLGSSAVNNGGFIPSPTYYRGQILAAQPGPAGKLIIYNAPFGGGGNSTFSLNNGAWTQSPLVASVPSTDGTYSGDEIVGYAVSALGVNTLELGSRDEQLSPLAGGVTGAASNYSTRAGQLSTTSNDNVIGAPEDTIVFSGNNWLLDFVSPENGGDVFGFAATPTNASSVTAAIGNDVPDIYADYDVEEGTAPPIRTTLTAATADGNGNSGNVNYVVGAAVGPDNILYMTVNEPGAGGGSAYIEAVNEQAPVQTNSSIIWRFELTGTSSTLAGNTTYSLTDASGISYDFNGYQFLGPPVVGTNGMVYAVARIGNATSGTTRLMAFNANPAVGIDNPFSLCSITQTDEFGTTANIATTQFTGDWQVANFSPVKQGTLQPSLFAPGVLEVTQQQNVQGVTTAIGGPVPIAINTAWNGAAPMLEWYTTLPVYATSAAQLVGDYVYFGYAETPNGGATSYGTASVLANPATIGLEATPETRLIPSNADYRFVQAVPARVGQIEYLAATDKYLVTAGSTGVEGLSYNAILVADANRLIELDPDGNATWTMDATQEPSKSVTTALTAVATSTSVPFNRPSTVTQINTNDFLIADTGNNRCVHVDSTGLVLSQITDSYGNVITTQLGQFAGNTFTLVSPSSSVPSPYSLEINSFNDPLGILPNGESTTLDQPSSVVTWLTYEYANGTATGTLATAINVHYLIADTGNSRILDIVDRYNEVTDSNGIGTNTYALNETSPGASINFHYLSWISHTTEIGGRTYGYVGAQPILNTGTIASGGVQTIYPNLPGAAVTATSYAMINQAVGIIGVVGDKNIAALDLTQPSNLSQVNQDSAGSSILLLNYTNGWAYPYDTVPSNGASVVPTVKSGLPFQLINSVAFDNPLNNQVATVPLRGLRSAIATAYSLSPVSLDTLVIADDDGVFNGTFAGLGTANITTDDNYLLDATYGAKTVGWEFVQSDYNNIVSQYDTTLSEISPLTSGSYQDYLNTLFVPASAIELSGNNYLIVNRGASGNPNAPTLAGNVDTGFGGNVFTVHATVSGNTAPVDSLDGPMYGHPANTGALSTPAFALRSK